LVSGGLVGESLGDGVTLVLLGDGDGLGDELGDDEVVGLRLGEPLGLADDEGLTAGGVDLQLRDGDGDPADVVPVSPLPESVPDLLGGAALPLCPPGSLWWILVELSVVVMAAGSAAIAHVAAATTKTPVAIAAAGRSQPSQPSQPALAARPGSGRNLSTTTPSAYLSQITAGSSHRSSDQSRTGTAVRQLGSGTGCLAEILAWIRSRPSAAGSTESAASRSAFRSTFSSAV